MNSRKVEVDKCTGVNGGQYCELALIQATNLRFEVPVGEETPWCFEGM